MRRTTCLDSWCLRTDGLTQDTKIFDVLQRWVAEEASVFATELRGTFVADAAGGGVGVERFCKHQMAGRLKAELFLKLERTHGGHGAKAGVHRRWAHVEFAGELGHADGTGRVPTHPFKTASDALEWAVFSGHALKKAGVFAGEEAIVDFSANERSHDRNVGRLTEESREAGDGVEEIVVKQTDDGAGECRGGFRDKFQFGYKRGNLREVEHKAEPKEGMRGRGLLDTTDEWKVKRDEEIAGGVIEAAAIVEGNAFGALRHHAENCLIEGVARRFGCGGSGEVHAGNGGRMGAVSWSKLRDKQS